MWMLLEASIVIGCFALGCRRRNTTVAFLLVVVGFLLTFGLFKFNPIGLLASVGGWLILDAVLISGVISANVYGLWQSRFYGPTTQR